MLVKTKKRKEKSLIYFLRMWQERGRRGSERAAEHLAGHAAC